MLTTGFLSGWTENMFSNETNVNCVFEFTPPSHSWSSAFMQPLSLTYTTSLFLSSLDYLVLKVQSRFSETLSFSSAMFLCSEVVLIRHLNLSAPYLVMSP